MLERIVSLQRLPLFLYQYPWSSPGHGLSCRHHTLKEFDQFDQQRVRSPRHWGVADHAGALLTKDFPLVRQ
jgi:hypothetical protein